LVTKRETTSTDTAVAVDEQLRRGLGVLREDVDAAISARIETWSGPPTLLAAMRYALSTGGKRLRPCLTLAACSAAGGSREVALGPAVALEFIHTYSLVHDDLPAMDDDAIRRGQPTVHAKFGHAMGILCGDALLTEAFATIAAQPTQLSSGGIGRCVAVLARRAGADGMVGGQVLDIEVPEANAAALRLMHAGKTGALFVAACELGAIAADADEPTFRSLAAYGAYIGEAFQVSDDLDDFLDLGASGGAHEASVNLAAVLGVDAALATVRQAAEAATLELDAVPGDATMLRMIAAWIVGRAAVSEQTARARR